jgi:hypothetical protein
MKIHIILHLAKRGEKRYCKTWGVLSLAGQQINLTEIDIRLVK